ncbi:hypothetical protein ABT040_28825 [Streptomyces sp. NPDC002688]|uniref:effector-associated constant component EACC1 n=1 Tax=Streptomyces sp. NPDC002688 TaxID=3154423 RepID=UPI003330D99D
MRELIQIVFLKDQRRGVVRMRVQIESGSTESDGPSGQVAAQLTADFADWLTEDRDVSLHAEIRRIRPQRTDGAMSGDLVEWISLVISSGFSTTALVYAHKSFRAALPPSLRQGVRMVIEHGDLRLVVEGGTEQDATRIAQALAATAVPPANPSPQSAATNGTPSQRADNAGS